MSKANGLEGPDLDLDLINSAESLNIIVMELSRIRERIVDSLIKLGYAKQFRNPDYIMVSRDKEWLSGINSIGDAYVRGGPKGDAFIIDGHI